MVNYDSICFKQNPAIRPKGQKIESDYVLKVYSLQEDTADVSCCVLQVLFGKIELFLLRDESLLNKDTPVHD
eukprot:m.80531 g.80531  ORF g.80531 m.80531 type:complete len:72 (+) comp8623_c1_seq1:783-998(+)